MSEYLSSINYSVRDVVNVSTSYFQTILFSDAVIETKRYQMTSVNDAIKGIDGILGGRGWSSITLYSAFNAGLVNDNMKADILSFFPRFQFTRVEMEKPVSPVNSPLYLDDDYMLSDSMLVMSSGTKNSGSLTALGWQRSGSSMLRHSPFASSIQFSTASRFVEMRVPIIPYIYINTKNGKLNLPIGGGMRIEEIHIYLRYNADYSALDLDNSYYSLSYDAYYNLSDEDIIKLNSLKYPGISNDPYSPGGNSGGGGGGGSFDNSTSGVGLPGLPSIQLTDLGFFSLYNPAPIQVRALADYMWSDTPNWDDFKKIMANPMDAIIGLSCVPVAVPNGAAREVFIGNIATGINMFPATSQWVTHSCGSVTIPEYWGAYLDYAPYTNIQLYLPYIGVQSVSANDLLSHAGKSLTLQYNVDILSGACVASLLCGSDVLYGWQGSCGMQVPFTSLTYGNLINGLLQVGAGAVTALANPLGGLSSMISGGTSMFNQDISHGGGTGGAGGFLNIQTPYFIITRPNMCMPADQNTFIGLPSFITVSLSDLKGWTQVESIHIENVPATSAEIEEIESLLKSGVIM